MLSLLVVINLACAAIVHPFEITTNSASDIANKIFSYVIVGGGTAGEQYMPLYSSCQLNTQSIPSLGLTIAKRLTDNREVMVLVIKWAWGQDGQGDPRLTNPPKSVYFFNIVYFFCKLDRFLIINSHHVAASAGSESFDLTWGVVGTGYG